MKKIKFLQILLIISFLGMYSCSTKKNTAFVRFYHNTTAYFNIYFNGNEGFKNGIKTVKETSENYTQLLPIYKNERKDIQSAISGDMDIAIKKSVKMIKMHSITSKPKRKDPKKGKRGYKLTKKQKEFYSKSEYNNYVDDAYLLMGKAHYYKGDYNGALRSLNLILNKFRKEKIRFDAMYWIARTQSAQGNYKEAENYLKLIIDDKKHPEKLNLDIDIAYADIFLKQKKYDKTLEKLDFIIEKLKKKKEKARFKFLTAQIYQKINKGDKAIKLYSEVIKMSPPYEMVFNAKINMAKSFIDGSGNSEKIKKTLSKLLKDDKNIDFQDQIYYVLAGVEKKDGNENEAVSLYKKSVEKSVSNENQKALSYLSLADIYFERRSYLSAGNYYDSTMSVLNTKYPEYDLISAKANNLKALTDNLKLINREDSLQKVAKMDSVERNTFIASIIQKLISDEKAALNAGQTITNNDNFNRGDFQQNPTSGKWYFYNPQALSMGKSEFMKVWGKRKLEDHWRRKNKQIISDEIEDEQTNESDSGRVTDNKKPEFYLQDLPLTDSLIAISNEKIARAYYQAGVVYERRMKDYPEAQKSYKALIKRFPKNELIVEAYFNMYLLNFKHTKNKSEAEKYRNKILNEYPYSKYAKILSDPDYFVKLKANKKKIDDLYSNAYNYYKAKKYQNVINTSDSAFAISKENHLAAKFTFLKGMSVGSLGNHKKMQTILTSLVTKYPKDEIAPTAQEVLDLLASGKYDPNYYTNEKDSIFYFAITTNKEGDALNKIKYILTTFNVAKFPKEDLKTKVEDLGKDKKIITVEFLVYDAESVKTYISALTSSGKLKNISKSDYQQFIISSKNLQKLKKLPIIDKYLKFYKANY